MQPSTSETAVVAESSGPVVKTASAHHLVFVFLHGVLRQGGEVEVLSLLLRHHHLSMLLVVLLAEAGLRVEDAPFQSTIPQHELLDVGAAELVIVCNVVAVE